MDCLLDGIMGQGWKMENLPCPLGSKSCATLHANPKTVQKRRVCSTGRRTNTSTVTRLRCPTKCNQIPTRQSLRRMALR